VVLGSTQLLTEKIKGKVKGKVHPIRDHEGPEGEKYNSTIPSTSAPDGGG